MRNAVLMRMIHHLLLPHNMITRILCMYEIMCMLHYTLYTYIRDKSIQHISEETAKRE